MNVTGRGGEREVLASLLRDLREPILEIGTGACARLTLVLGKRGLRILANDRDAEAVRGIHRDLVRERRS